MAWNFRFIGTITDVAPAIASLAVTTSNSDEDAQVSSIKSYVASKLSGLPGASDVNVNAAGVSNASGVSISLSAQIITIT